MADRVVESIPLFKLYDGSQISIPLVRYGDSKDRVLIVTPLHGNELTSIYLMWRLMEYIESSNILTGGLDILLGVNYFGILFNSRFEPLSNSDLNRSFPGGDEYSLSGHIAKIVYKLAKRNYKFVIDLHGAGYSVPHIIVDDFDLDVISYVLETAKASRLPYVWDYYDMDKYFRYNLDRSLPSVLVRDGIPSFTFELPTAGYKEEDLVNSFNGILNILTFLGVTNVEIFDIDMYPEGLYGLYRRRVYSEHAGFVEAYKLPGEKFVKYEDLVVVKSLLGDVLERVRISADGYVISIRKSGIVRPYESVASVGISR